MNEAEFKFSREGIEGIAPVGASLASVMRRFGIRLPSDCDVDLDEHYCSVTVSDGGSLLSPISTAEKEHFNRHKRRAGERLACQAIVAKPGGITIMTAEKEKKVKEPVVEDKIFNEFAELPLEEKIAKLAKMEAVALSETISFVLDSPFKVFEKFGDMLADIGMKKDTAQKAGPSVGDKPVEPSEPDKDQTKAKKPRRAARRTASPRAGKKPDTP
ncbi:MAG: 2Fe-2S iron-sulfur cluster binding domain-containing protein [Pyrinomonadaceae bacterium]|nr:2Fe-2S iron-sulfur cluster binding domain-containing protein [Pyrinomonadaceae bacterium]